MKKVITIISIICVLIIAAAVLFLTGVIKIGNKSDANDTAAEDTAGREVAMLNYMDTYILLDDSGNVLATAETKPEGIPLITGIEVIQMVSGETIEVDNEAGLSYAMEVVKSLRTTGISDIEEIFISSENEITMYVKNIKILLGQDDQTAKKITDLKNFYDQVENMSGSLDMQEANDNNQGYTFKKSE